MKKYARLIVAAVVAALVLAGCGMPLSPVQESESLGTGGASLPPDEVRDVSRSVSGPFTFETLFPVDVRLAVDLYEIDESGRVVGDPLPSASADVFVTLDDSEGNRVFAGMIGEDGELDASIQLPSAAEDMTLTVRADGFETRTIVIDDMVTFELIDRKLSLRRVVPGTAGPVARNGAGNDADGDGVIDTEDDEPDDPTIAFYSYVPSREAITVAYEDLFGRANAGDADYNDFIASYTIREGLNADGNVTQIYVAAEAVEKLAGYNHRFGIRLDSFEGKASVTGSFVDLNGTSRDYSFRPIVGTAEIDLFMNSRYAKDKTAEFTVTFDEPQVRDGSESALPEAPYNPYLFVYNTGHDIHLIGREANTISKNPDDPFVDEKGFPWALLVPRDWIHPDEGVRIEVDYPRFTLWRESGGTVFQDWYEHDQDPYDPGGGGEDATVYVAGYYDNGSSLVPVYWLHAQSGIATVELESSGPGEATDLDVDSSGGVHAVGWYNDGANEIAAYWRDGVATELEADARATGIVLDATGVAYVSGYYFDGDRDVPVYWIVSNGEVTRRVLPSMNDGVATDITLDVQGTVYISGYYNDGVHDVAVYWSDDGSAVTSETLYPAGLSQANAIAYADGAVYVAGRYLDGSVRAAYWITDQSGLVSLEGTAGNARAIVAPLGVPIAVGDYNEGGARQAVVWDGTENRQLEPSSAGSPTFAFGAAHVDGTVYASGVQQPAIEEAVYWGPTSVVVLAPGSQSRANAIVVAP